MNGSKKMVMVLAVVAAILAIGIALYIRSKKMNEEPASASIPSPTEEAAPPTEAPVSPTTGGTTASSDEAQHIQVQHILIGFEGSLPGKKVDRSKAQAEKLANDVLEKSKKAGANFDSLVKEYTDDQAPGIYGMSNTGIAPEGDEFPRDQMVPAFGDIGFKLKVGEIGLASFDPAKSPFGFHIIKRLK